MYWYESRYSSCLQYDHHEPCDLHIAGHMVYLITNIESGTNLYRCLLLWYNCPAAAPPVEPEKVVYTDVNSKATVTDKITGY